MTTWKMAVIGLESRDQALLETAIDLASGLEIGRWELVDDQENAQVILANLDVDDGQNALDAYDSGQADTLVVPYSSSNDIGSKADITLSYPLSYKNVTSLLKTLEMELVSAKAPKKIEPAKVEPEKIEVEKIEPVEKTVSPPAPAKPTLTPEVKINPVDIVKHKIDWLSDDSEEEFEAPLLSEVTPLTEHVATDNIETLISDNKVSDISSNGKTFTPDSRLLGLVQKIIESGKTTQINHVNYPELRIFPDNGWFIFTEELDSYPDMFRVSAESFSVEVLNEEIKDELFNGRLPQSLWKLLFTAALFGSEGRLLEHLDRDESFHLMHTPYFGMIPHTSDHIEIAEFMVDNNSDIETISNSTNIDIETVIDFCNACDAIQLLKTGDVTEPAKTDFTGLENDTTIESEIVRDNDSNEKPKKSGLINSLWSSLTKSS